ncbi:MAG: macro domain-containing protein [Thermoplasmatota archaeon]
MIKLKLLQGDISRVEADIIVNAANNHLWMGSGVAGAIRQRGGRTIEDEAVAKGPVEVGTAVATTAGELNARYVIHGAVMGQDLRTDPHIIEKTTLSCLELADELGAGSIALPAFGCGVGGVSYRDCASAMKRAIIGYGNSHPDSEMELMMVLFGGEAYSVFLEHFDSHDPLTG